MNTTTSSKLVRLGMLVLVAAMAASCSEPQLQEYKRTSMAMGTALHMTVCADAARTAEAAFDAALIEINRIERLLSNYEEDSEVSRLNRDKRIDNPSFDLYFTLLTANYYSCLTSGAFDVTVQPLSNLYAEAFRSQYAPPSERQIKKALRQIGYDKMQITREYIVLGKDQEISLSALAAGYAVDCAIAVLRQQRIAHALVELGGEVRVLGRKMGSEPWRIGIRDPRAKDGLIETIELGEGQAVSTSGDYESYFDLQQQYHHLIDPRTGYSARDLSSSTIVADTCMDADALSTSVFVLGREKGLELIEKLKVVQGVLVTRDGAVVQSSQRGLPFNLLLEERP